MDRVSYQRKSYSQVLRGYTVGSSYVVILNCMYITLRTSVRSRSEVIVSGCMAGSFSCYRLCN